MLFCVFSALTPFARGQALVQGAGLNGNSVTTLSPAAAGQPEEGKPHGKGKRTDKSRTPVSLGMPLVKNIVGDQKAIWTSPRHLRAEDATWLVPLGGLVAAELATDRDTSLHLSNSPSRLKHSRDLSNLGAASLIGTAGGLYLLGKITKDEHKRETGLLAGEALIDSLAASTAVKYAAGRERPMFDQANGRFWQGGNSFPSDHSAAAWAVAGVLAHEYPGPLTKLFAYGLASAVSASRVTGKEHFPSDVVVGGMLGWLIGQYVYRAHHNPDLPGAVWGTFSESQDQDLERQPGNMGSPYVPLDSWVYPALTRLAALGIIHSEFLGLRPWTRLECARLVNEAEDQVRANPSVSEEAKRLYQALRREFAPDLDLLGGHRNRTLRLESVYTRVTGISGMPLTDGYHFGQTVINDFGRPYSEGFNNVTGFSGWGTSGHFVAYVRGEFQHAPSIPPLPEAALNVVARVDATPLPPNPGITALNRFRLLDSYVGMNLSNWQVSFGKQSLWWGPGKGGPMLLSDNAEPINMFRVSRVSPMKLPSVLGWLGPIRTEFFIGQLDGHPYIFGPSGFASPVGGLPSPQPFIHGEKFSFKPTPNFEFSVSRTTIFAGSGVPLNWHTFLYSFFGTGNGPPGSSSDPGDRRSAVDLAYRIPKLRNWLTFYADGFTDDQFSPIGYADRSSWRAGLYLPRIPKLHKLDFRGEGVFTDVPAGGALSHGFFYWNTRYRNGYTNDQNLLGSWIGREGQGAQVWSNYWISPQSKIQLKYRHQKVSQQYLPGGGTLNDAGVQLDLRIHRDWSLSTLVQYEKWLFPVLAPVARSNVTTSFQLTFWPAPLGSQSRRQN